jgi:hypothetical protein
MCRGVTEERGAAMTQRPQIADTAAWVIYYYSTQLWSTLEHNPQYQYSREDGYKNFAITAGGGMSAIDGKDES